MISVKLECWLLEFRLALDNSEDWTKVYMSHFTLFLHITKIDYEDTNGECVRSGEIFDVTLI